MNKFITGKELEDAVYNIIWEAKETLLIVSPFIKLDGYFMKLFEKHINNYNVHLLLVFGKNEGNANKSLGQTDFDFFKKFPNVSIIYEPKLHAKYFGNENKGVITSINLYDYSFKNNIEFGVYSENSLLSTITQSSTDQLAWNKCKEIAENGEPVFVKRPVLQKKLLSAITGGKNYIKSDVLFDGTESFFSTRGRANPKRLADYPGQLDYDPKNEARPARETVEVTATGYCIRTGAQIPFNVNRPYSAEAYKSWAQWNNPDYKENYCHKTGRASAGKTSMRKPVLE